MMKYILNNILFLSIGVFAGISALYGLYGLITTGEISVSSEFLPDFVLGFVFSVASIAILLLPTIKGQVKHPKRNTFIILFLMILLIFGVYSLFVGRTVRCEALGGVYHYSKNWSRCVLPDGHTIRNI